MNIEEGVLYFEAEWCSLCSLVSQEIADIDYDIKKIDVDNNEGVAVDFGVSSLPTLIKIEDGEEVSRMVGYNSKEDIVEKFNL